MNAAAVASDVFERMAARGTVKGDDFRIIYRSETFPSSGFAYAHDLKPEIAEKLKKCFYDFRFPPEMQKDFEGDDRFFPITYLKDWAIVRKVAEDSGTPYNKSAYEKEAAREAEAAKKIAEADGDAKSEVARAQGEAEANRIRQASIPPQLLELRRLENQRALIDRWNGQLPQVESGSGSGLMLQLPKPQ